MYFLSNWTLLQEKLIYFLAPKNIIWLSGNISSFIFEQSSQTLTSVKQIILVETAILYKTFLEVVKKASDCQAFI